MRRPLTVASLVALLTFTGCKHVKGAEPVVDPRTVPLTATAVPVEHESDAEWVVSYPTTSTPVFRLRLAVPQKSDSGVAFGKGMLIPISKTAPAAFLDALKSAMEAKTLPKKNDHPESVAFLYAFMGSGMSHSPDGSFTHQPAGRWMTCKFFLPDGDDNAEVYFNVNMDTGEAELSEKDAEYGDGLLRAFNKLF